MVRIITTCCFALWLFTIQTPACIGIQQSTSNPASVSSVFERNWSISSPVPEHGLRGLHVVDSMTVWACGGGGTVLTTSNGGKDWKVASPAGWSKLEFRSIYAWDAKTACIASAGTPAILLRTEDGGEHWIEVYRHPSNAAFFDTMQFWNPNEGMAVSDPIDGRWVVVQTTDAGKSWRTWTPAESPSTLPNEAAFAASNGSLFAKSSKEMWLASGGNVEGGIAGVYLRDSVGGWLRKSAAIRSNSSSGVFGIVVNPLGTSVLVGGDYEKEATTESTAAWSNDGGKTWEPAQKMPSGFRSSVIAIQVDGKEVFIAAGPNGIDRSPNGREWTRFSEIGFHAIRWEPKSDTLWGIGSKGRIGHLRLEGGMLSEKKLKTQSIDEKFLFVPSKYPVGDWSPDGLKFEDVTFQAEDSTTLHGWYCPCANPRATILMSHGNAGNIATRANWLRYLQTEARVSTFIFDYRGYGKSAGEATVEGVLLDASAARTKLKQLTNLNDSELVLMGESLGGAIAIQLAAQSAPKGLVLQSTFTSLNEMAKVHFPGLAWLVPKSKLNSLSQIDRFHGPLLQSHGTRDTTIPFAQGEKLFRAANQPKTFLCIQNAEHNNWLTEEYLGGLDHFLDQLASGK